MESQSLEFHQRVRQGYLDLAKSEPERVKVVDGSQWLEEVGKLIWAFVEQVVRK